MSHIVIIDIQALKGNGNVLVCKELAVIALNEDRAKKFFIKLPHPWYMLDKKMKRENRWLQQNYPFLNWEDGEIDYGDLMNVLHYVLKEVFINYVKGIEKKNGYKKS